MTRREGRIRHFFGRPGSARRRRLRALPVLGPLFGAGVATYRFLRDRRRDAELAVQRARTDFENRRAHTVRNVTRRNNRRAYERVYGDDSLLSEYLGPERIAFYETVAEISARERPRAVIDVGCGTGNLLRAVVEKTSPERVVGIDHAEAGIVRARQLVPSGEFRAESLYDLEPTETFDLVLCTEVLEHLRDPQTALEKLVRLCARSGRILITVPDGAQDTWEGHRNFWSKAELDAFLRRYGEVEISRLAADEVSLLAVVRP
ncbi:MAG: class I SAM-dependent methyltransferase [Gaiellaceae bacterium]